MSNTYKDNEQHLNIDLLGENSSSFTNPPPLDQQMKVDEGMPFWQLKL